MEWLEGKFCLFPLSPPLQFLSDPRAPSIISASSCKRIYTKMQRKISLKYPCSEKHFFAGKSSTLFIIIFILWDFSFSKHCCTVFVCVCVCAYRCKLIFHYNFLFTFFMFHFFRILLCFSYPLRSIFLFSFWILLFSYCFFWHLFSFSRSV